MSLVALPENGSAITVSAVSNSDQYLLFSNNITVGGGYAGCLDRLIVNQQPIPLLNPIDDVDVYTCGPRVPSETAREFESGAWLFGAGSYIQLSSQQLQLPELEIQFVFRTLDASGVLLFYPSNIDQYLLVYLSEGRLAVDYNLSPLDLIHLETEATFNSGLYYQVHLLITELNIAVTVNGTLTLINNSSTVMNATFTPLEIVFFGGISADYSAGTDNLASASSIAGCIRNLQFGGLLVNIQDSVSNRVEFGGCPQVVAPGVRFMGTGRAEFLLTSQHLTNITFGFKTTQLAALLFSFGGFTISVFHTKLRFDVSGEFTLVSDELGLNDNTQHTGSVLLSLLGNSSMCEIRISYIISYFNYNYLYYRVTLIVDGETTSVPVPRINTSFERLFVGGTSDSTMNIPVKENFRGCIDSVTINGR